MKLVDLMMKLGMNRSSATMALPMMWFTPATTDRYSNSTIEIIRTLQSHFGLPATGQVGAALSAAMITCCGRAWQTMTWAKIYRMVDARGDTMTFQSGLSGEVRGGWSCACPTEQPTTRRLPYPMGADEESFLDYVLRIWPKPDLADETATVVDEPWCSTIHPNGNCKPIANVCKPMTGAAAELYKKLQAQLNRVAFKTGKARIAVDGRPGKKTVKLCNQALGTGFATCDELCRNASRLTSQAAMLASSMGAPASVPSPKPSAPPSVGRPDGSVRNPTMAGFGLDHIIGFATSPPGLLLIAGFAAWKGGFLDEKKPKRRTTKRRKRATRRR